MAKTLLSFGVQKLWDLLVRESDRFKEVDEPLTELKSKLNLLRSFLKDADAKKHTSKMVKTCVEEIKEIVLDAEDIIESFLLKKELEQTSIMRRLSFSKVGRRKIASDIGDITKRISKVIRDMQSFSVQQMIVQGSEYSHPLQIIVEGGEYSYPQHERQIQIRKTFPSDNESDIVGLEKNVKKLVGYMVEDDSIQVVSIIGMGGIGKTTLARQVFNHEMVKNHFDGVAWVCISQKFTKTYVWQTIFEQLSSKHDEHGDMTKAELHEKLFQLLETSKSLIVLDDMWADKDWDKIKLMFPAKKGWKVLLTSRNGTLALLANPRCVTFTPECLTIEDSWTLFRRIVFPRIDTSEYKVDEKMEEMGRKMIKHCGGLPLAIKVLGGLLAAQHTLSEWNRVHENIRSHIIGGTSFNDRIISLVEHILYLSFEELPVYLKQCFLYFAHFPQDHPLRVRDLSYYWASEGMPRPRYYDGATIEEVGNGCIEELVKRNMVISEREVRTTRFETYRLHDIMKKVCLLKAKEENFVHIVDIANSQSPCTSRRIAVHQLDETYHPKWELDETYHPKWEIKNPKLRSLLIIKEQSSAKNWMASGLCFTKLQLMRVLDLSYAKFEGGKLPSDIGKLIHLRYLSLYQAHVNHLPSSMRNLKLLLYLNLTTVGSTYIPNFLKDMRSLAYLSLPLIMHIKTKLELGNLVNLETLLHFSTKNSSVSDLHRMTKLRNLSIHFRGEGCATKTLSSSLSELRRLGNLTISLEDCRLVEDPMPILEKLVQLKELYLGYKSFSGKRMVCSNGGFPQLHKLSIQGLKKWEEWMVEEGSMPLLDILNIWNCPKLKELPDGLRFISSKNLILDGIWKERLSEGGEDYYKRCSTGMAFLVVINLLLEIVSAVSDQLSSIRKPYFATISLLMSISSIVLSILDLTYKIQAHKARFRCKWPIPWFYHPEDGYIKIFGNFTNTVLLFCVVGGLIVSSVNYSYIEKGREGPIKVSVWPLFFAIGMVCSKFMEKPATSNGYSL